MESAQAAAQIAISSQEQLAGVEQVVTAMENIKQASTQSTASTKQLEATALALTGLGQGLKESAEQYKV
jgi:methyl-accepting chemotaxis protein